MAIRLRTIEGQLIAICAARSVEKPGDVYLDDAAHQALAVKFDLDLAAAYGNGSPIYAGNPEVPLMEREESNNPNRTWWDTEYGVGGRTPEGGEHG